MYVDANVTGASGVWGHRPGAAAAVDAQAGAPPQRRAHHAAQPGLLPDIRGMPVLHALTLPLPVRTHLLLIRIDIQMWQLFANTAMQWSHMGSVLPC